MSNNQVPEKLGLPFWPAKINKDPKSISAKARAKRSQFIDPFLGSWRAKVSKLIDGSLEIWGTCLALVQ
jgi:hypothetical protein